MAKKIDDVSRALKLRAKPKNQGLTFRHGTKKYVLPFEVRYLASEDYLFVHVPPAAGVLKITPEGLAEVTNVDEAVAAQKTFRAPRKSKRASKNSKSAELPDAVKSALAMIPAGHRVAYGKDGSPRLVRTRNRKK
jgi:hypothetical protein